MAMACCGQGGHGQNGRRMLLVDQIRRFVDDIELEEHERSRAPRRSDKGGPAGMRDMDLECREYRRRREGSPPTITAISVHETRPTSHYTEMKHENNRQLTYVDASEPEAKTPMPSAPWELPRTQSQELRAGTLYVNCDCLKRNGLQLDCPRWECGGRPECVAINPGPCCGPSIMRKPVRGDRRSQNRGRQEQTDCSHLCKPGAHQQRVTFPSPQPLTDNEFTGMTVTPVPGQQGVSRVRPAGGNVCHSDQDMFQGSSFPTYGTNTPPSTPPPSPQKSINICYPGGPQGLPSGPTGSPPLPNPYVSRGPPVPPPQTVVSQGQGGQMMCVCTPTSTNFNSMAITGCYR